MLVSSYLAYHYQGSKPLEDDGLRFTGNFWIMVLLNCDLNYMEIRNILNEAFEKQPRMFVLPKECV